MITLELAKQHLRIEPEIIEDDAYITRLIESAYLAIERQTGVAFRERIEEFTLDGFSQHNRKAIELPFTPVQRIESVAYIDSNRVEHALDVSTLRLDQRGVYPRLYPANNAEWPNTINEPQSVTIQALVGYPDDYEPADIQTAALLYIGHLYTNREAVISGSMTEVPMGVKYMLEPFTIHRIG